MIDKFVIINKKTKNISLMPHATPNNVVFRYYIDKLGYASYDDIPKELRTESKNEIALKVLSKVRKG